MPTTLAIQHLLLRLRPLNRALRAAVERQAIDAAQLDRPDLTPYCITDEQVLCLLDRIDNVGSIECVAALLTPAEKAAEQDLCVQAAACGADLPLDHLVTHFGLTAGEQDALLLCAAPELDHAYERIFAYILDDLNRRFPCIELLATVGAGSGLDGLEQRRALSRAGTLRRAGLVRLHGEAPTELRQELRLAPGLVDFLLGFGGDLAVLAHDPGAVSVCSDVPPHIDRAALERLGRALRAGDLDLVGVWGPLRAGAREVVPALAEAAGMPLRQLPDADIAEALDIAAAMGALLWVPTLRLGEETSAAAELLARSRTPVVLSGEEPWRPAALMCTRAYAELVVAAPTYGDRKRMWGQALPDLGARALEDLAARYRMSGEELRAVAAVASADASLRGAVGALNGNVQRAVAMVTSGPVGGFAHAVEPRRGIDDLVLPVEQQRTVLELAAACRTWPRVAEEWGFAAHGGGGVKALFTGDPGTGKTLAAEVIAGILGLRLLKVDLSQVVSKWVGETEKNLEAAFRQAEDSQALLFFDEADVLFGKRGEVKHGMDRYANLEVGFLLQRLERSDGLVILASNLKENIDKAFTRRFHYIIHFPRPEPADRQRLWRLAFPPAAPLASDVELPALAHLDMTGASIASAARTAALLAADAGCAEISMAHVIQGIGRQYQRDARLLRPDELGHYAGLLEEVTSR